MQTAFFDDRFRVEVQNTHFAGHDYSVVVGHVVATWTQSVSIENRTDDSTVSERNRRRTVPRFLQARVIFVERSFVFRHGRMILPCFGDRHHDDFRQTPAGHHQHFHRVVELTRVTTVLFDDWHQAADLVAKESVFHQTLTSSNPVAIASKCVDLTVVSNPTQRLGT